MSTFVNYTLRGVGTTLAPVTTASAVTTVIGLSVANTTGGTVTADVTLWDGTTDTYLVKGMDVVPGSSQVVVGGDQKLVLTSGQAVRVKSSAAASLDVIMSALVV